MTSADLGRLDSSSTEPAPAPGARGTAPASRDPFFDNAKYLTILLVACGHAWEPLTFGSRAATAAYLTVYAFHIPAFALISGYFSRSFDLSPRRLKRLFSGVVVPYLIFETAYTLFYRWAQDDPKYPLSLLDPWFLMWFLVALFIWRLTTPLWQYVRWPVAVSVVVATMASVSPDTGGDLSLQRVLQFLPFFVVGLRLRPEHFDWLRAGPVRTLSLPVAVAALGVAYWVAPWCDAGWFYRRSSVQSLGVSGWVGLVTTPALFCLSLVLTACFLAWVPRRQTWFTALGAGTLYGYLLHGFLVKASRFWDWYDHPWLHGPLGELVVTAVAVAVVTVLCTAPIRRTFRFAVEPRLDWLARVRSADDRPATDRTARAGRGGAAEGPPTQVRSGEERVRSGEDQDRGARPHEVRSGEVPPDASRADGTGPGGDRTVSDRAVSDGTASERAAGDLPATPTGPPDA